MSEHGDRLAEIKARRTILRYAWDERLPRPRNHHRCRFCHDSALIWRDIAHVEWCLVREAEEARDDDMDWLIAEVERFRSSTAG